MLYGSNLSLKKTENSLSAVRKMSLYLLIIAFVFIEVLLPRMPTDNRFNLPVTGVLMLLALVVNAGSLSRNLKALKVPTIFLYLVYISWTMLSVVWSYTPSDTIFHSSLLFLGLLSILSFADVPPRMTARMVINVAFWVCLLSWMLLVVDRQSAVRSESIWRLNGIMAHSQRLAFIAGTGLILMIYTRYKDKAEGFKITQTGALKFLAFVGFFMLTLAATRTRAFTTFILLCAMGPYIWKTRIYTKVLLFLLLCTIPFVGAREVVSDIYHREESNDESLTGRVMIWEKSWELIKEKPLTGYGFASFYSDLTADFFSSYRAPHAHNTWVNSAFETGFIGAFLLSMFLFHGLWKYGRLYMKEKKLEYGAGLLLLSTLCGATGLAFGGKIMTPACLTLLFMVQELQKTKSRKVECLIGSRHERAVES